MRMNEISIEVHGLSFEQALYVNAVLTPQFYELLKMHESALVELGGLNDRKV